MIPSIWPFSKPSIEPTFSSSPTASQDSSTVIPPLIICEGFLSAAQSVVWGNEFRLYLGVGHQQLVSSHSSSTSTRKRRSGLGSSRTVVFAPIGPVSSLHDRACELFYALRGGTVDYGLEHSRQHGHARFGRHYPTALCPSWGTSLDSGVLPAHFLGHSLGGPTILKLQQLLRQGFFDHTLSLSPGTKPEDLILSITSVSSPFRGTPLVYSLGSEPLPYPKVRMFSFGDVLSKLVHIAAFLDVPFFDAHADAWSFSARRRRAIRQSQLTTSKLRSGDIEVAEEGEAETTGDLERVGLGNLLRQLWKSDWASGRDCAPWDCTFAERDQDRAEDGWGLDLNPHTRSGRTWYRSYAGGMTVPDTDGFHRPESYWSVSPLTFTSHLIGRFDYSRLSPTPAFMEGKEKEGLEETWRANDGVVPLASQFHPFDCHPETCRHFHGMPASLPFGRRQRRAQSTDLRPPRGAPREEVSARSSTSEADTLVDGLPTRDEEGLPLPATHPHRPLGMLSTANSAAKIAYLTSLRALHLDNLPLLTPTDEELSSFLPATFSHDPSALDQRSTQVENRYSGQAGKGAIDDLLQPSDNRWYTFQIDGLDHTSLCPFWTGSEVQKQFWTGMGIFLASVDRMVGFEVEPTPGSRPSTAAAGVL